MSEMKVGDIGVLQNLELNKELNGSVAEIVATINIGEEINYEHVGLVMTEFSGFKVMACDGHYYAIKPHQIRPISDPDQEEVKQDELEIA